MTGSQWKQLAQQVISRRTQLGMKTTKALADAAGLTARMVGDIENARRENYSAGAKAQIENALHWTPGSIDDILSGREPGVSGTLRDSAGRVINRFTAIQGGEQQLLELLVLGKLIMDARDFVHGRPSPDNNMLARSLDEASELVVRAFARAEDYDLENAEWRINQERATNSIRRQGDLYVIADDTNEGESDVDQAKATRASSEADEGEKTRRGVGRRRASVRAIHDDQIEVPPIEYLAAESGGPKGIPDIPSEAEESQDPDDHPRMTST